MAAEVEKGLEATSAESPFRKFGREGHEASGSSGDAPTGLCTGSEQGRMKIQERRERSMEERCQGSSGKAVREPAETAPGQEKSASSRTGAGELALFPGRERPPQPTALVSLESWELSKSEVTGKQGF